MRNYNKLQPAHTMTIITEYLITSNYKKKKPFYIDVNTRLTTNRD